ncbi:MAG: hypothetical protein K8R59_09755 [Thermoanaerobaculales bacterium]|nr:hypothetical protein [Thermoanaerobaculales bacterium]
MTDLPQLYAALMIVEQSWPSLATVAASVRVGMFDLTDLWNPAAEGACPGQLFWAMHMCDGVETGPLNYYGNDALLGEFLAVATGAAPPTFWSECLPREGCELCGVGPYRFYAPGDCSCGNPIPATAVGGPFLQLAPLTYLDSSQLPIGSLSLADSAANMLAAQRDWAADQALALWGWANHSDAETCNYLSCTMFTPEVVTPYISGMGLSLTRNGIDASCAENLFAFEQQGAGAPLDTGTVFHDFGLLDAWNHLTMSGRNDNFLYLDTGWLVLGAINACHGDLVRQRFAAHPVATNGYALLASLRIPCPVILDDGFPPI